MAIFLKGNDLNNEMEKLVELADDFLYIVSPFVKMHQRFKDELSHKKDRPEVEIVFLFGKNENDLARSFDKSDIAFLREFPNITIAYKKELHAKYYVSEDAAIITSLNLYSYSQDKNIEAGVILYPRNTLNKLTRSVMQYGEEDAYAESLDYFKKVIKTGEVLFKRTPEYESQLLGLKKKYKGSNTEVDKLDSLFSHPIPLQHETKKEQPLAYSTTGYCIRTGVAIPFNMDMPMTCDAFTTWSQFSNREYPEKFCHYSGEKSNGETCFGKPILKKNWPLAKSVHGIK